MTPRVAAVIGHPIAHSLSPTLHQAAFDAGRIDAVYVAFDVAPGRAAAALDAVRTLGLLGLSVTTPHKEDVAAAVDELAATAAVMRSVNTVVVADGGRLIGHSTDGDGFVASLSADGIDVAGARVGLVGAGAAARSLVDALGRAGVGDLAVVNRHEDRAEAAARLAAVARVGQPADLARADIVINATSVGMGSAELAVDPALLSPAQIVADLVYHPLRTALLTAAAERGCRTVDGLGMLVHQAVLQQLLWTGRRPDPVAMRAAAERELGRRAASGEP